MSLNNPKPGQLSFQTQKPKTQLIPINNHWDKLYNYSKYLTKTKEQKASKQRELTLVEESRDCTFHPITHYSSNYQKKKDLNILNTSIAERQSTWEGIKVSKIQRIANKKHERDHYECKFFPNIHKSDSYLIAKALPTENIVLDPESFKFYLKRRNKMKIENIKLVQKRENTPGNGKIWKNKQTVFQEFKFETNKLIRNKTRCKNLSFVPISKSNNSLIKNHSYTLIRNTINKEYDTDINQYMKAKDRLHSELFEFKL